MKTKAKRLMQRSLMSELGHYGFEFIKYDFSGKHPKIVFSDGKGSILAQTVSGTPRSSIERWIKRACKDIERHFKGRETSNVSLYSGEV